ncbi:MAG: threonine/serine exporter family protein [Lachnospiraceae bacterium]|nr:threonine/serine exporter family protein [Lachnospiraceae bacterium]
MIIQTVSAFFVVFMFTVLLELPRRYVLYTAASGAMGWWMYLMVQNAWNSSMMAAFVSTLVVAFLSHILARLKKAPVTVFFVSGTLPAVPGAAIYRSVYYFIHNDPDRCSYYLAETLQVAGAIAMAIFIMDSLFRLFLVYQHRKTPTG